MPLNSKKKCIEVNSRYIRNFKLCACSLAVLYKRIRYNDCSRNNNTIRALLRIIDLISDNQWDRVKTLWILDVNGMKPNDEWQFQHLALNTNI